MIAVLADFVSAAEIAILIAVRRVAATSSHHVADLSTDGPLGNTHHQLTGARQRVPEGPEEQK